MGQAPEGQDRDYSGIRYLTRPSKGATASSNGEGPGDSVLGSDGGILANPMLRGGRA
jgi:hypothetical protein